MYKLCEIDMPFRSSGRNCEIVVPSQNISGLNLAAHPMSICEQRVATAIRVVFGLAVISASSCSVSIPQIQVNWGIYHRRRFHDVVTFEYLEENSSAEEV